MLSKDEIEVWIGIMEKSAKAYVEVPRVKFLELLRSELSVQEGVKDAREAFEDFVTPNGYSIETDPDGEYACPEVRLQKYAFMAGARHNAAFALKQKGQVVWEGVLERASDRDGVYLYSRNQSDEAAIIQAVPQGPCHVTISLPQQEQE